MSVSETGDGDTQVESHYSDLLPTATKRKFLHPFLFLVSPPYTPYTVTGPLCAHVVRPRSYLSPESC